MKECAKACERRSKIRSFTECYMVGNALDIGSGTDGLTNHRHCFPKLTTIRDWDLPDGDAQLLEDVEDETFDTVHSSHCLEHMRSAESATHNWLRVLKPLGHLVIVVPDFALYEQHVWPSTWNPDHKLAFSPLSLVKLFVRPDVEVLRLELLDWTMPEGWRSERRDYSLLPSVEPAIEIVVRKRAA